MCEIEVLISISIYCPEYWIYGTCFSLGSGKTGSLQLLVVGYHIPATIHRRDAVWDLVASAEIWWPSIVISVQCVSLPHHQCTQHLYHYGALSAEEP